MLKRPCLERGCPRLSPTTRDLAGVPGRPPGRLRALRVDLGPHHWARHPPGRAAGHRADGPRPGLVQPAGRVPFLPEQARPPAATVVLAGGWRCVPTARSPRSVVPNAGGSASLPFWGDPPACVPSTRHAHTVAKLRTPETASFARPNPAPDLRNVRIAPGIWESYTQREPWDTGRTRSRPLKNSAAFSVLAGMIVPARVARFSAHAVDGGAGGVPPRPGGRPQRGGPVCVSVTGRPAAAAGPTLGSGAAPCPCRPPGPRGETPESRCGARGWCHRCIAP